jgi:hypothetical protein
MKYNPMCDLDHSRTMKSVALNNLPVVVFFDRFLTGGDSR